MNRVKDVDWLSPCLRLAHHFTALYFPGLDKSPVLQPVIAATLPPTALTSSCSWPSYSLCWHRSAGGARLGALWCHQSSPAERHRRAVSHSQDNWPPQEPEKLHLWMPSAQIKLLKAFADLQEFQQKCDGEAEIMSLTIFVTLKRLEESCRTP